MPDEIRVQDLRAAEIADLLSRRHSDLTREQATAVWDFVESIGGIENACNAVEMLSALERTA